MIRSAGPVAVEIGGEAAAIGIIGGADGPTAICMASQLRMAASSMRFEHVHEVEWCIVFLEKLYPDIDVTML